MIRFSLPCFSVSSQADDCLHNEHFDPRMRRTAYSTERHICMGVALPSSLSYLLCLFFVFLLACVFTPSIVQGKCGVCGLDFAPATKDCFLYRFSAANK